MEESKLLIKACEWDFGGQIVLLLHVTLFSLPVITNNLRFFLIL